jgi:hypothetical protein
MQESAEKATGTRYASAFSDESDTQTAAESICAQLTETLSEGLDVIILFASSFHDYSKLLKTIWEGCKPGAIVGCSSAGEFTSTESGTGAVSAMGICSNEMTFRISVGHQLDQDRDAAAREIVSGLSDHDPHPYKTLMVFADALAGHTDELIDSITRLTGARYQIVGGGAGDDAKFTRTHVFANDQAYTSAAVALELCSDRPVGIGVRHGWEPATEPMRVTEAAGMRLISINATSPLEVFQEHAEQTGQHLDVKDPVPFFLHNTIGIVVGQEYKLRVPLQILEDGSFACASDIPVGSAICIMKTSQGNAKEAASDAVSSALLQLKGHQPKAAIFFDCVATRLRLAAGFTDEIQGVYRALGEQVELVGCNTYGQIARVEGQFSGFHNCTAVVCVLPE